jgi:glutathione S-transferase
MQLIGMLDSPYVRRVAISLKLLGIPFDHQPVSVFRNVEAFSTINPLIKAPTLICDDGNVLMDSTLILDYIERMVGSEQSLMPNEFSFYQQSLRLIGIALVACEKAVQIFYERTLRPVEKQHQPWFDRVEQQLIKAYGLLEPAVAHVAQRNSWLISNHPMQPDITIAVAWRFTQYVIPDVMAKTHYPALAEFSDYAERLPEFISTPLE